MIVCVAIPPFLRITLQDAMATMHFQIVQTVFRNIFNIFMHFGGPSEQMAS